MDKSIVQGIFLTSLDCYSGPATTRDHAYIMVCERTQKGAGSDVPSWMISGRSVIGGVHSGTIETDHTPSLEHL